MRSLIRRSYPPLLNNKQSYLNLRLTDLKNLKNRESIAAPQYAHAHYLGYGVHRYVDSTSRPIYITMLRNPEARFRSLFRRTPEENGGFRSVRHGLDSLFSDINQRTFTGPQLKILKRAKIDNVMTKTLGCRDGLLNLEEKTSCTLETYELAQERLLKRIDTIMISERFDESVLLLQKILNLRSPYYRRVNTGNVPYSANSQNEDLTDFILSRDHYDCKLYTTAVERFDSMIRERFQNIEQDLGRYRWRNRIIGNVFHVWDNVSPIKFFYK